MLLKISKGKIITYSLICILCFFPECLCAFQCFWCFQCFLCMQNLFVKKKFKTALITSFILLLILFLFCQLTDPVFWLSYQQTKKLTWFHLRGLKSRQKFGIVIYPIPRNQHAMIFNAKVINVVEINTSKELLIYFFNGSNAVSTRGLQIRGN